MVMNEEIELFGNQLDGLTEYYETLYNSLRKLKRKNVNATLIEKSEKFLANKNGRLERLKKIYEEFSCQFNQICEKYVDEVNTIEKEDNDEAEELKSSVESVRCELEKKNEELGRVSLINVKEPSFVYREALKSKMDGELVMKYPGSYLYREFMDGGRTAEGDVFVDCDGENDELIVKYMKNDESLEEDLKKLNFEKKSKLLDDLSFLELPIKRDVIREIGCNEDNEMMEAWRNRRVVLVNGKNVNDFNRLLKRCNLFNFVFNNEYLKNIQYYKPDNLFYIDMKMKYYDVIEDYLKNGKKINKKLIKDYDNDDCDELMNEMKMIGIELNEKEKKEIKKGCYYPMFTEYSSIINNQVYDKQIQEWFGNKYEWELLFRASENEYKAESFHECCDDMGPTLVIIKSTGGWIFGGYTTRSWSGNGI